MRIEADSTQRRNCLLHPGGSEIRASPSASFLLANTFFPPA